MLSRLRRIHTAPAASTIPPKEKLEELIESHRHRESDFLNDACLNRYLTARSNDPEKAATQLIASLEWRASYGPTKLHLNHLPDLRRAAETGKMFVLPNPDRLGRAVIVMRPGLENQASEAESNIRYLVYTLERASKLSESASGDGKFVVVVDFFSGKVSVSTSPGLAVMRETTSILQNHYPERLGGMVLFEAPSFFTGLFRLLRPFVDPVTREKIHFAKRGVPLPEVECLDAAAVPKDYGGTLEYEFDLDEYFASRSDE